MKLKYPLILASNSPRRQQLLRELGINFTIKTHSFEEVYPTDIALNKIPAFLAKQKAQAFEELPENDMVLTADTIVALENKILGKPKTEKHAALMLSDLSGKTHQVYTGVCLRLNNDFHTFTDCTDVIFKSLSKHEIEYYIKQYKPLDKAGSYGIQEWIGMIGIEKISGSYFNVVGLPVAKVYELFKKLDLLDW